MAKNKKPIKKKPIDKKVKKRKRKVWLKDDPNKPLLHKEKVFVLRYITNLGDGNEAAIFAKFGVKSARSTASTLLTKPNIQRYYNEQLSKAFEKNGIMVNKSMMNLARMANSNITDFYNVHSGEIDPLLDDMPKEKTQVIHSIEVKKKFIENPDGEEDIIFKEEKIKLYDNLKANIKILEMAGKFADIEEKPEPENLEDVLDKFLSKKMEMEIK